MAKLLAVFDTLKVDPQFEMFYFIFLGGVAVFLLTSLKVIPGFFAKDEDVSLPPPDVLPGAAPSTPPPAPAPVPTPVFMPPKPPDFSRPGAGGGDNPTDSVLTEIVRRLETLEKDYRQIPLLMDSLTHRLQEAEKELHDAKNALAAHRPGEMVALTERVNGLQKILEQVAQMGGGPR
jgi:hypothetical protein